MLFFQWVFEGASHGESFLLFLNAIGGAAVKVLPIIKAKHLPGLANLKRIINVNNIFLWMFFET